MSPVPRRAARSLRTRRPKMREIQDRPCPEHQTNKQKGLKSFFIDIFRRNIYLLLVALVLFLSGYFLNLYFNSDASVAVLRNSIQSFLQEREKDFEGLTKDTTLLNHLSERQYSPKELEKVLEKKY